MDVWILVALPATTVFAEEHQQNNHECTAADERPTGSAGEMPALEKHAGHGN